MDLPAIWFVLLGILIAGYAILDGFDLGVGILLPFVEGDAERRLLVQSIGPIWNGNEVWLVTFGGSLFAAFPEAYATIFSAFYIPFMLVLMALIFRAASIEFRDKIESSIWRKTCDFAFFASSLLATLLFGAGVGSGMIGIPLNERGVFVGSFSDELKVYPLLVGLFTAALFAMHGTLYLGLRQQRVTRWTWHTWGLFLGCYLVTTIYTLVAVPRAVPNFEQAPWVILVVALNVLAIANIPRATRLNKFAQAFLSSSVTIATLVTLFSIALWPNLVTSSSNPDYSLTIYRASSSEQTLKTMLLIACIGMPLVVTYTSLVYWTFRRQRTIRPKMG